MKINYLKLKNIGPYIGEHCFDLNTNSYKNINLIGGKNGAGKTTFLKAIKYGMFGSFSLGLKTDTVGYFNEIKTILNNRSKNNFMIEIGFEYIENFESYKYVIRRNWSYKNKEIFEEVKILQNNLVLDDFETKEIIDKIRAITSPQLINSFIFDGEKIGNIIENEEIPSYLEEVFNSIFNIDLIKQTTTDLENYLSKKASETKNKEALENVGMISKINSIKSEIAFREKNNLDLIKSLNDLKLEKKNCMDDFYKLGGMTKSQQEKSKVKVDLYANERDRINKEIKNYIETDLPIAMNFSLLENAFTQAQIESHQKYISYVEKIEKFLGKELTAIKKEIMDLVNLDTKMVLNLSDSEFEQLEKRIVSINVASDKVKPLINDKHLKYDEYKLLKKSLENNDNIVKITELLDRSKKLDDSIHAVEEELKTSESQLKNLNDDLAIQLNMFEKSNEMIKKDSLYDASFVLGKNALDLCEKFKKRIKRYKLREVSKKALEIFCDTIRKQDFITDIKIDESYNLILTNSDGVRISPKSLSAGEMQILVSSIIWAMFRVSGRREMFIFDTPLARLDSENRQNFISKIISTISSQVIILSTDSEFVGENYKLIADKVYKHYLLEFDEAKYMTTVSEKYFGGTTYES